MNVNKPFSSVWWCNYDSLPLALTDGTKSVIGVADNTPGLDWSASGHPGKYVPRIILPHDENKPVGDDYIDVLLLSASTLFAAGMSPITVFCWAGQHRSPAACAVIQAYLFDEGVEGCVDRVSELWTPFATKHRFGIYASSLIENYKLRVLGN